MRDTWPTQNAKEPWVQAAVQKRKRLPARNTKATSDQVKVTGCSGWWQKQTNKTTQWCRAPSSCCHEGTDSISSICFQEKSEVWNPMYSLHLEFLVIVSVGSASLWLLPSGDELWVYSFCLNLGFLRAAVTPLSILLSPRTKQWSMHAVWGELAKQVACLALCNHLPPYLSQ